MKVWRNKLYIVKTFCIDEHAGVLVDEDRFYFQTEENAKVWITKHGYNLIGDYGAYPKSTMDVILDWEFFSDNC